MVAWDPWALKGVPAGTREQADIPRCFNGDLVLEPGDAGRRVGWSLTEQGDGVVDDHNNIFHGGIVGISSMRGAGCRDAFARQELSVTAHYSRTAGCRGQGSSPPNWGRHSKSPSKLMSPRRCIPKHLVPETFSR